MKRGKKYQNALKKVQEALKEQSSFPLEEACDVLVQTSTVKFDASCEVHIHLGIDPKQGDQMVRSTVVFPNGTGKNLRIIAFVPDDLVKDSLGAGALEAGSDALIDKVNKGWLDFDVAVAHPDIMKHLGKVAKTLGPKGLMPNPKAGTVTPNVVQAINEVKRGKVEFRNDKEANLHNIFGKVSFGKEKLLENLRIYLKAVADARPSSTKGTFMQSVTISTTMGPPIGVRS